MLQALQLMADMQAVSRRPAPLWGVDVEAALRTLADTLRHHYSRQRLEEQTTAAGGSGEKGAAETAEGAAAHASEERQLEEEEARKLGRPAGEQAAVLAARQAARLQPSCLKLVKDLLQRRAGGGKHD